MSGPQCSWRQLRSFNVPSVVSPVCFRFCNFIRCWCVHESSWTVGQMNSPALDFGRSLQRRGEICMESWGEIRWVTSILTSSISSCLMTYTTCVCIHEWYFIFFMINNHTYHIYHICDFTAEHKTRICFSFPPRLAVKRSWMQTKSCKTSLLQQSFQPTLRQVSNFHTKERHGTWQSSLRCQHTKLLLEMWC